MALSPVSFTAAQVNDYSTGQNQVKLFGSSFGLAGQNASFDYVVVGGGTSGLVVANRLLENPNITVAVVEAGGYYEIDGGNQSQIPFYAPFNTGPEPATAQPLIDWGMTSYQPHLNNRTLLYAQGKCLGGGSARNYMVYQRGTKGAYQLWANEVGDQDYAWDSLLPYFKKSCHFTPPNRQKRGPESVSTYSGSAFSATGGPLQVSYQNFWVPLATVFRQAFSKLGFAALSSFDSGELFGYSEFTTTINPACACRSTSTTFLQPNDRLQVYTHSLAERILFSNLSATAVMVPSGGHEYNLSANHEVILAAGALRTPQLLMVSGVGTSHTLQQLNIPVLQDSPSVGQNMWDQPLVSLTYRTKDITTTTELQRNATYLEDAIDTYRANQSGPLAAANVNAVAFEKLPARLLSNQTNEALANTFPADWPDIEILPLTGSASAPQVDDGYQYFDIFFGLVAPFSRGNVSINTTSTSDNPVIEGNWVLDERDQEIAVAALRRGREVAGALATGLAEEYLPGAGVESDAELGEWAKNVTASFHHAAGTCRMGDVVDTHGLVKGISRLRIVDASVFRLLPPGQPQSTVYALAEKLADDIKASLE